MRTLKKTLCLVLCLAMMAGFCAIGASAAFTDAAEIKYEEAVAVLTGIGVINGMGDGTFAPAGTLTRAQACKIVAYLLGDEDVKGTCNFTDCKGHWAENYIAYCAGKEIVNGVGDNQFLPDETLTGAAFCKMVLVALGYNADTEGMTGAAWEVGVGSLIKALELDKGIAKFDATKAITREEACQIAFNALQKNMVAYKAGGVSIKAGDVEIKTTAERFDLSKTLADGFNLKAGKAEADEFGRPCAKEWTAGKDDETIYKASKEALAVVTDGTFKKSATAYKGWDFSAAKVIYNGGEDAKVAADVLSADGIKRPGYTVELYGTKSGKDVKVDTVVVFEYYAAKIAKVDAKTKDITVSVKEAATKKDIVVKYDKDAEKQSANYIALADFAKDDVLAICVMPGWDTADFVVLDAVKAESVEGKVSAKNITGNYNGTITVDGTKYTFAWEYSQEAVDLKSEGTFYFTPAGYVLDFAGKTVNETKNYAYVVATYEKTGAVNEFGDAAPATYFVQAVNTDGETVTYQTKDNTYGAAVASSLMEVTVAYDATAKADLATFKDAGEDLTATVKAGAAKIAANKYVDSDVKFIYVSGAKATLKVTVKDGVQALESKAVEFVVEGESTNKTVKFVFVESAYSAPTVTSSEIVFVSGDKESTGVALVADKDGKEVNGYAKTVYVDGVKTEINAAAKDAIDDGFYTMAKNGDLTVLTAVDMAKATNLKAAAAVANLYNGMLTTADVEDMDVAGAEFVDLTANDDLTDATKLTTANEVALVLSADLKTIEIIYVVK